jgi:hypothetical protein
MRLPGLQVLHPVSLSEQLTIFLSLSCIELVPMRKWGPLPALRTLCLFLLGHARFSHSNPKSTTPTQIVQTNDGSFYPLPRGSRGHLREIVPRDQRFSENTLAGLRPW